MTKSDKQLLNDNKFKIGFEFEFVAYDLYDAVGSTMFRKLKIRELAIQELEMCFSITNRNKKNISDFLCYAGFNQDRYKYYGPPEDMMQYGTDRLIVLFKLEPTVPIYRKTNSGKYIDVTKEMRDKILSTDCTNAKEFSSIIRSLSRCYVDTLVTGEYSPISDELEDHMYDMMERVFEKNTGVSIKRLPSHGNESKSNPAWYLTEEYVDDIDENGFEYGFEVITPALPPIQALRAMRMVFDFMRITTLPFKIRTGSACGVHINISHEDITDYHDTSQIFYTMMFDEAEKLRQYGRSKNTMCSAIKPLVIKEIKRLTHENIITIDGITNPALVRRVIDIIESSIEGGGLYTARFDNMKEWGYSEYRMAGGIGYEKRYDDIEKLTIELLRFTMLYGPDITKNSTFIRRIVDVMKEAGATPGTGLSFMETLPDRLFLFPNAKRPERKDCDYLLNNRDV